MTSGPVLRITPPLLDDPGVRAILRALPAARVVGGAVRDAIAGRPGADVDFATPERPEVVIAALAKAGIRSVPTGLDHGTVTAVVAGRGFEVTTLRRDVETDGRHAVVAFTTDWQADAARRDFTINAMSMDGDGAVFDYFDGIDDLRAGIVRFVGDPACRIAEDYLRILRYFRFYARYAAAPPDPELWQAIREGIPGLTGLSVERVWNELARILATPDPAPTLALMSRLQVLAAVLPEAGDLAPLHRLAAAQAPADAILRLAAILDGDPNAVAARLRLSGTDRERLIALRGEPVPRPDADEDAIRRMLADTDGRTLEGRTWLTSDADPAWDALRRRLAMTPRPVFPISGKHALALGIAPGRAMGALLQEVRAWWLAGGCRADAAACLADLRRRAGIG